jgi:hypothetical protein
MGTGGARWGAGRPGYRLKAEQTLKVDLRIWRKLGYLVNGSAFAWQWSRGGEVTANIGVSVRDGSIRFGYTAQGARRRRIADYLHDDETLPLRWRENVVSVSLLWRARRSAFHACGPLCLPPVPEDQLHIAERLGA